ncbi:MAG: hypothetical protein ACFFFK_07975 [Candidatus Thorarchaeota archaeon]
MFDVNKTAQSSPSTYDKKYSSSYMKIGIVGAISSLIFFLVYYIAYAFDLLFYELFLILNPILIFLLILTGIGYLGFFQKFESNLAFPAIFIFLLQNLVDLSGYVILIYEVRLMLYVAVLGVVGLMMLTFRKQVENRMLLLSFVVIMSAKPIVPYLIRLLIMPTHPGFGDPSAVFIWLSPYIIFNTLYYLLFAILLVFELRNMSDYQRSSW